MKPTAKGPPILLNGARVLLYVSIDSTVTYTGRTTVVVGGNRLEPDPNLAVCENLVEGGAFLMHCDSDWNVLGGGYHSTAEAAIESAELGYSGIRSKWQHFRALTSEEEAYVESTRERLRALALAHPNL